jgi:effector-binding domain-containing protein
MKPRFLALLVAPLVAGCAAAPGAPAAEPPPSPVALAEALGVPLTVPPYRTVHADWKERIAQPYVYFEHRGPRESFGETMRSLLEYAVRARVETAGAPFGLFVDQGPARACLPVEADPGQPGLPFGVLPQGLVAYAVVSGPYPDASRALPGLVEAMAQRGWKPSGAVREVYLVNPAEVASYASLTTELQVPWSATP